MTRRPPGGHRGLDNVLLAGGGSGHGFKHGPVLGDYVAARTPGEEDDPDHARLFGLRRPREGS